MNPSHPVLRSLSFSLFPLSLLTSYPVCSLIPMFDPPRHDTKDVIEKVRKYGISVKMITGDQLAIARETCRELGIHYLVFHCSPKFKKTCIKASVRIF